MNCCLASSCTSCCHQNCCVPVTLIVCVAVSHTNVGLVVIDTEQDTHRHSDCKRTVEEKRGKLDYHRISSKYANEGRPRFSFRTSFQFLSDSAPRVVALVRCQYLIQHELNRSTGTSTSCNIIYDDSKSALASTGYSVTSASVSYGSNINDSVRRVAEL